MARPRLHVEELRETALYQEMLENRRRAAEAHERARRVIFIACNLSFFFWTAVTIAITSWGMGTVTWAYHSAAIIEAGLLIGGAGILGTLLFAYHRLR